MRKHITQGILMLSFTVLACQTPAPDMEAFSDQDQAAIRASAAPFAQAMVAADHAAIAAMYTENAVLMPSNASIVEGRAAIQTWSEAFPKVTECTLTPVDIDGRGDLAFVRGTFTLTLEPEGAPGPTQDRGKYVEIRQKQSDGSWLMAVDIFNSDLPSSEEE